MNIPALTLVPAATNKIPNNVSRSSIEYKMWWDSPSLDTGGATNQANEALTTNCQSPAKILRWCHLKKNQP